MAEASLNSLEGHCAMPHLTCSNDDDLNRRYPSMYVPEELYKTDEPDCDTWDGIARRGDAIIKEIMERMSEQGRRRCE
jgi:hypothetical protein